MLFDGMCTLPRCCIHRCMGGAFAYGVINARGVPNVGNLRAKYGALIFISCLPTPKVFKAIREHHSLHGCNSPLALGMGMSPLISPALIRRF